MLSSVAKPPPTVTQPLSPVAPPPKTDPAEPIRGVVLRPPPLPPRQVVSNDAPQNPRLSTTTHVKLPPKTNVPKLVLSGMPAPVAPAEGNAIPGKTAPPPLPRTDVKKTGSASDSSDQAQRTFARGKHPGRFDLCPGPTTGVYTEAGRGPCRDAAKPGGISTLRGSPGQGDAGGFTVRGEGSRGRGN